VALFGRADVSAQVVTTQPEVITQDTKNVVITFHADWGNRGMVGLSSSAAVYAHTGVITNKSKSNQDWLYSTSDWETPQAKFKMTYAGPNLWTLTNPRHPPMVRRPRRRDHREADLRIPRYLRH